MPNRRLRGSDPFPSQPKPEHVPVVVIEVCCERGTDPHQARWLADQLGAMCAEATGKPDAVRSFVRMHTMGEPVTP